MLPFQVTENGETKRPFPAQHAASRFRRPQLHEDGAVCPGGRQNQEATWVTVCNGMYGNDFYGAVGR
jgi:hypothetical protein